MPHLVVDGYNVVHAWPALKKALVEQGLQASRRKLLVALAEYAARSGAAITVVFDAHTREERGEPLEVVDGVTVRYGTRTQSADHVIERLASQAARSGAAGEMIVVTGDRLQRALVGAMGVATMSPGALEEEVALAAAEVTRDASRARSEAHRARRVEQHLSPSVLRRLEALRRGEPLDD
ncbi:MAG: NYN domain-containing protein [Candidatus Dormibacteraeota bacterium]|nr:NYN domain-containing protein [Candidatus Dormibacteraeota bacterium]MBV9526133.1 NYN domain-containing protein [Candidatus Dormibacteraeota bacterium]